MASQHHPNHSDPDHHGQDYDLEVYIPKASKVWRIASTALVRNLRRIPEIKHHALDAWEGLEAAEANYHALSSWGH